MARLKHTDESTSLFPFLNVLLCLVGALVLGGLLVSVGRLAVAKERAAYQAMWREYQRLHHQSEDAVAAGDQLASRLLDLDMAAVELARLRKQLNDLEPLRVHANQTEQELQAVHARIAALGARVEDKRHQRRELQTIRDQRQHTKVTLPKPGSVKIVGTARMVGPQHDVDLAGTSLIRQAQEHLKAAGFDPGPVDGLFGEQTQDALRQYQAARSLPVTGILDEAVRKALGLVENGLHPLFVECRGEHVIVHPTAMKVPVSKLGRHEAFQKVMERVKGGQNKGMVLILMIRPDGVKSFDQVRTLAQKQKIRYGFLPIPGFGEIDLSAFRS